MNYNTALLKLSSLYMFWFYLPFYPYTIAVRNILRTIRIKLGVKKLVKLAHNSDMAIPELSWRKVCPTLGSVIMGIKEKNGNVKLRELATLSALCKSSHPQNVMEIGTFTGRSTLHLALNANPNAQVFTLDLPPVPIETAYPISGNDKFTKKRFDSKIFTLPPYVYLQETQKIKQLHGDSATFDFSEWYGKMDFVFVDGAHIDPYVVNDSDIAFKLLNPKKGVIVWHDYGVWSDVTTALNNFYKIKGIPLVHIENTSLVVYHKTTSS